MSKLSTSCLSLSPIPCPNGYVLVKKEDSVQSNSDERKSFAPLCSSLSQKTNGLMLQSSLPSKGRGRSDGMDLPPALLISPKIRHTYRYESAAAANNSISVQDIFGAIGGICTASNSLIRPWAGSFKINKVTVWPAAGAVVTANWSQGVAVYAEDREVNSIIPSGISVSRRLVSVPPRESLSGDWIGSTAPGASNLFSLNTQAVGCVVDLDITYTLSNSFIAGSSTVTTATLATPYYLALDGPGTNNLVPVALPTTH